MVAFAEIDRRFANSAEQHAYVAHRDRWYCGYRERLLRHLDSSPGSVPFQDFVWDAGALDLISPLDFAARDRLRKAGFAWGGRLETDLYLRIAYASLAELNPVRAHERDVRPIKDLTNATVELLVRHFGASTDIVHFKPYAEMDCGRAMLMNLRDRALREVGLRAGRQAAPEPFPLRSAVRANEDAALLEAYGFDGRLLLDRETKPDGSGLEWRLDVGSGRWQAWCLPSQIAHRFSPL